MNLEIPKYAYMNNNLIPWDEARIHVQTPAFRYGAMVFEGLRAYWNTEEEQLYLFRVMDHFQRLKESIKVMRMDIQINEKAWLDSLLTLIKSNGFREDLHIRFMVYVGGTGPIYASGPIETCIICLPTKRSYDIEKGISCSVSSWIRIRDNIIPPRVKCAANYQNGRLAVMQAKRDGYDYTLMLNETGKLTETPTSCIFMIRKGQPSTPRITDGILESITRLTVITIFQREIGVLVIEREIDRTELYVADEVFLCGTGAEVVPIVNIDGYSIGDGRRGPLTEQIQKSYFNIVRGLKKEYIDWLTPVY